MLHTEEATQIVAQALSDVTGFEGAGLPDGVRGSLQAILRAKPVGNLKGVTTDDVFTVHGLQLDTFTAGDADQLKAQWDEIWARINEMTRDYWHHVNNGAYPENRFKKPAVSGEDIVGQVVARLSLDWGK